MSDSIQGLSQSLRPPKEGPEGCLGSRKCGQFKGAGLGIQSNPTPLNLTLNVCRNIICQVPNKYHLKSDYPQFQICGRYLTGRVLYNVCEL